jgi:hypothetical protein
LREAASSSLREHNIDWCGDLAECIIGTELLLVFERSIDPKGMDKDLVFIYEPDVA